MKKLILRAICCVTVILNATTVHALLVSGALDARFALNLYRDSIEFDTAQGFAFGLGNVPAGLNTPGLILTDDTHATITDGSGSFTFGIGKDSTLFITNNITGWVNYQPNLGSRTDTILFGRLMTVNGLDNPNQSSVTGSKTLDNRNNFKKFDGYAFGFDNRNPNSRGVGSLIMNEGNYFGEQNQNAARIENFTNAIINGSSFIAANTAQANLAALSEGETAKEIESDAVFFGFAHGIFNFGGYNNANDQNGNGLDPATMFVNNQTLNGTWTRESVLEKFGNLSFHDALIGGNNTSSSTLDSLNQGVLAANGGSGIYSQKEGALYPSTLPYSGAGIKMTITGGDFFGGHSLARMTIGNNSETSTDMAGLAEGGSGILKDTAGGLTVRGGRYVGGNSEAVVSIKASNSAARTGGGQGIWSAISQNSASSIGNSILQGGRAGRSIIRGSNNEAYADGGNGALVYSDSVLGANFSLNSKMTGGLAGSANAIGDASKAYARGGNGFAAFSKSSDGAIILRVNGGNYTGASGGSAVATDEADAMGGNGIYAVGDVAQAQDNSIEINGGSFSGASGGVAQGADASADGGSGVRVENVKLTISKGVLSGGAAGNVSPGGTAREGRGVFATDSYLVLGSFGGTSSSFEINDGVLFTASRKEVIASGKGIADIDFFAGTINGDLEIELANNVASKITIASGALLNGSLIQRGGTVNVEYLDVEQAQLEKAFRVLSDVEADGTMTFNSSFNLPFGAAENVSFRLLNTLSNTNNHFDFKKGLILSKGGRLELGVGKLLAGGTGVELGKDSSISLLYQSGLQGRIDTDLDMSDPSARVFVSGIADAPAGNIQIVTGTASLSTNADVAVQADLGWLTDSSVNAASGINIEWSYQSLASNSALSDINADLLSLGDDALQASTNGLFARVNGLGAKTGAETFRFDVTQLPDVANAAFQIQQQVAGQIAARGTEFRSMNGFASSKPSFGAASRPIGAAGPENTESNLKGWIRAYGSTAERDRDGMFAEYDLGTFGTVIGVDKNFGNLLVGLAGGYATTELDAETSYEAKVDTYYGSLYSTIGGEVLFVDLAATYAHGQTEEKNLSDNKFDSDIYSGYVGAGLNLDVADKITITPETSLLASFYEQEAFDRDSLFLGTMNVDEYDDWSYLGTLGINLSSIHQIDWLASNVAILPELRVHWLHEFNDDLAEGRFTAPGGEYPLYVRPREEDLVRAGVGLDFWNWRWENAKFELDYDALFSSDYMQHTVSGKLSVQF